MNDNLKNILKLFLMIFLVISNLKASEKAALKAQDFTNQNVLHDAVRANDIEMVKYLVKQGVNINKQDEYEYTPLHMAVRLSQFDIASYLIANNAIINTIDTYHDTPLIDATRNNDTNISKLLICSGANRNVVDSYGMTTLHHSAKNKNQELINLLRQDNLKPYCQKELEISMHAFKVSKKNAYSNKICGDIKKGFVVDLQVEFKDDDDEIFGPFKADFNNEKKSWCIDTKTTTLHDDVYEVKAVATDHVVNVATDSKEGFVYAPTLDIMFDDVNNTRYPYPRICGTTNSEAIDIVDLLIEDTDKNVYGLFPAEIDDNKKRWCADITTKLHHGYYTIEVHASDLYDQYVDAFKENFFVDTMPFEINIENVKEKNNLPTEICGTSNKPNIQSVNVKFTDQNRIIYELPNAKIDYINKTWCSKITQVPPKGTYEIKATGINTNKEIAFDTYDSYDLGNSIDYNNPKISINNYNETLGNKPQICGKIIEGKIVKGKIAILDAKNKIKGTYKLNIDAQNKTWCSQVTDKLDNDVYTINAEAKNRKGFTTNDSSSFEVYVIPDLYEALISEFRNDMKGWNAELDKNNLVFSFRDPNALFKKGKTELNQRFQHILKDFFPRYVKVTSMYKKYIQNIIIEGHSSSENRMGKNRKERYELNEKLSMTRANNVLSFTNKLVNNNIGKNILWVVDTFESNGLSSSKLIYNEDGTENKKISRRVEFRIKNVRSSKM